MQDGYTQSGAGSSDMRVAGQDLQHARQSYASGGPMKHFFDQELHRHGQGRDMRLADLKNHYTR